MDESEIETERELAHLLCSARSRVQRTKSTVTTMMNARKETITHSTMSMVLMSPVPLLVLVSQTQAHASEVMEHWKRRKAALNWAHEARQVCWQEVPSATAVLLQAT